MEIKTHYKGRRWRNGGKENHNKQQQQKQRKKKKMVEITCLNARHLKKIQIIVWLAVHKQSWLAERSDLKRVMNSLMRMHEFKNIFQNGGQSWGCKIAECPIIFDFTDDPRFVRSFHYMEDWVGQ